ncbi:O-antigen ligase family protein [Catellatospora citrea]|uniref:O-antigen ligase-related domain-containing protein n=1 Tax=Catellatospora citrea TaxID=53366 RepID=A0A8J3KKP9_9ACTN|nr:O-antigen ligase family protein [Catellatospora citrea]RKE09664.1 O-antigen ligase-like membrane protein [Catellatospora citrea]GIG02705.1 hypothetical protein Cci01nite_77980 [Catellatospora citrea]
MNPNTSHLADFEPAQLAGKTYVTRLRAGRIDAATMLTVVVALICLVPVGQVLPGMTGVGRPGLVVGLVLCGWWVLVRFAPHLVVTGPQPMRWALLAFVSAALLSYAAGSVRGLTTLEINGANRALLFYGTLAGVILVAADGLTNWQRLQVVLQSAVVCAAIMAVLGIIQYVTRVDIVAYINIPGLELKGESLGFEERGAGVRVASTATHYIELAAVLALCLPFAIHLAHYAQKPVQRRVALVCALLIGPGIGATISRTGIVAVALTALVLVPVWTWRTRYNIGVTAMGVVAALSVVNPGLARTLFSLFDNPTDNSSIMARSNRYPMVFEYFSQRPILGRGTGTFLTPQYPILDNQWLGTLISDGVIGVLTLAGLHLTALVLAVIAFRRSTTQATRHLCACLIATQIIAVAVGGTFDSMSFTTYATMIALMLGLCGAVWRLTHQDVSVRTATARGDSENAG